MIFKRVFEYFENYRIQKVTDATKDLIFDNWHSWDSTPWNHPWLSRENLSCIKDFSNLVLDNLIKQTRHIDVSKYRFGFLGNIANNLYVRMNALSERNPNLTLFQHPDDQYIMSQPEWELYDGSLNHNEANFQQLKKLGYEFPEVLNIKNIEITRNMQDRALYFCLINKGDIDPILFKNYFPSIKSTLLLRKMDALWCTQYPYYGYFSGRPYVVSQVGGDAWFECSRGDLLGFLQRTAFKNANMFLTSNPISYAHARRYGFNHLIYLPLILDETLYAPGEDIYRKELQARSGGDFFVFSTSRLDKQYKNNEIAIHGFAKFSKKYPSARLVLMTWGEDIGQANYMLADLGIQDKVIWLPVSGKARLREYYRSVDCFFDQFVLGYYGGAGLEAMASGLPVISRIEKEQYESTCSTGAPPILQSQTSDEVYLHLERLYIDQSFRKERGEQTRKWFLDNHSAQKWRDAYFAVLIAASKGYKVDFSDSPLSGPLNNEELEYHQFQLMQAPVFPEYKIGTDRYAK